MPTLVLMTGSGRSGTSSMAGSLKRLGFRIPQPEVATKPNNPLGYYEPRWVAVFHAKWLKSIRVRDVDTRPTAGDVAMADLTPEREERLRSWLADDLAAFPDSDVVVIKETRAYWVYPLWQRVAAATGVDLVSMTMLRHPTQVVRSRDTAYLENNSAEVRLQRETANVAAWINSVLVTELATRENPRAFVPYPDLLADWRATVERACSQVGVAAGDLTAPHAIDEFITPSLNRSADTWEGLTVPASLVALAERTWAAAMVLVEKPFDAEAQAELDDIRAAYAELYAMSVAIASDDTATQLFDQRARLQERLATKTERLARLREQVKALRGS